MTTSNGKSILNVFGGREKRVDIYGPVKVVVKLDDMEEEDAEETRRQLKVEDIQLLIWRSQLLKY